MNNNPNTPKPMMTGGNHPAMPVASRTPKPMMTGGNHPAIPVAPRRGPVGPARPGIPNRSLGPRQIDDPRYAEGGRVKKSGNQGKGVKGPHKPKKSK